MDFFLYNEYANISMSLFERLYPFIIIIFIVIIYNIVRKKYLLKYIKVKKIILIMLFICFCSYYLLQYIQCGIKIDSLPLELCSLSGILCMVVLNCNNMVLVYFLESISMPATLMALISPATGGSFCTLQYQLFILNHILVFIIPLGYIIIDKIVPNIFQFLHSILYLLILTIFICFFNFIYDTSYMFISFKQNPLNFGIIGAMGDGKIYLLYLGLVTMIMLMFWGCILHIIRKIYVYKNKKIKNL